MLADPIDDPLRDHVTVAFDAKLWRNEHFGERSAFSKDASRASAGPQLTALAPCLNEVAVDR